MESRLIFAQKYSLVRAGSLRYRTVCKKCMAYADVAARHNLMPEPCTVSSFLMAIRLLCKERMESTMYRYAANATLMRAAKYCLDLLISSPYQTQVSRDHKLLLILGVDGSGKTTLAHALAAHTGAVVHEATTGPHSKGLKKLHHRREIDANMVHMREYMYASLTDVLQREVESHLKDTNIITTGSILVTRLANYTMRRVIAEPNKKSLSEIVDEWLSSRDRSPDEIIYLHAPMDVIIGRILERLRAGDIHELPVAYNSPFYLNEYNKVLSEAALYIAQHTTIPVADYDTSILSPDEIVAKHLSS